MRIVVPEGDDFNTYHVVATTSLELTFLLLVLVRQAL